MWEYICLLGVCFVGYLAWVGVFKKIKVQERNFEGGFFFYLDYQDVFLNVITVTKQVAREIGEWNATEPKETVFPMLNIYYDDPYKLKEPHLFRASIGFLVRYKNQDMINFFQKKQYKVNHLPQAKCLYGDFPYTYPMSFKLGSMKFYPQVIKYLRKHKIFLSQPGGSMEMLERGLIKYYIPLEKRKDFHLTQLPDPSLRSPEQLRETISPKRD